jgi:hypothetical protein
MIFSKIWRQRKNKGDSINDALNLLANIERRHWLRSLYRDSIFYKIERWIAYRLYDVYHKVDTGLPPGYYDSSHILLHAAFAILVDFVENDCGSWGRHDNPHLSPRERGLDYLAFSINLPQEFYETDKGRVDINESQRKYATEVRELYLWWKDIRPNRIDGYDFYLKDFYNDIESEGRETMKFVKCDEPGSEHLSVMTDDLTEEERNTRSELWKKCRELEESYHKEDQAMLHRLIDVRDNLWT